MEIGKLEMADEWIKVIVDKAGLDTLEDLLDGLDDLVALNRVENLKFMKKLREILLNNIDVKQEKSLVVNTRKAANSMIHNPSVGYGEAKSGSRFRFQFFPRLFFFALL